MNEENKIKIDKLIENLKSRSLNTLELINDKYIDSDNSGGFVNPGEAIDPDFENANALNNHLALFKSVESEINFFITQIEESMKNAEFAHESEWVRGKEKLADEFFIKLKALL